MDVHQALGDLETLRVRNAGGTNEISQGEGVQ